MPYSRKAKYKHHRQKKPGLFIKSSFRTVPITHTAYRGKKFKKPGVKAVVGKLKSTKKWATQSILEPKKKSRKKRGKKTRKRKKKK